jgi:peroxiredoxin
MKKTLLILVLSAICSMSNAQFRQTSPQTIHELKLIADKLNSLESFQADCELEFKSSIQGKIISASNLFFKKVPGDTLCGFYYYFKTHERYKDNFGDCIAFFNNAYYSARNGAINKYSLFDEPDKFKKTIYDRGFSPAIHRSSLFLSVAPIEISKFINESIADKEVVIHRRDTIVSGVYCHRYLIVKGNMPLATSTELCVDRTSLYPLYYKRSSGGADPQYNILKLSNTRTDNPSGHIFNEEKLFGRSLGKNSKQIESKQLKIGQVVPDWELPVLGKNVKLSSKEFRGKYILLEFTGTWCPHCWDAVKMMNKLEDEFKANKKLSILSVFSTDIDTEEKIKKFANEQKIRSTILHSAKNVGDKYYVTSYPSFFIIDPTGKLIKIYTGYSKDLDNTIANYLRNTIK